MPTTWAWRSLLAMAFLATGVAQALAASPIAVVDQYRIGKPADGATTPPTLMVTAYTGVLANDRDADGDALTAVLVTAPANGTLTLNADGSFTYVPGAGFIGANGDSFQYKANDGSADSATVTVALQYVPTMAIYTGDIIEMRVADTGAPDIYVAGKSASQVQGFVQQYYAPLGTVVWLDGGTRFSTNYFSGTTPAKVSHKLFEIKDGEDNVVGARVETVLDLGLSGLRLTQTLTCMRGNRYVSKSWTIRNTGESPSPALRLFHGGDTYFGDNDSAYGFFDPANTMVYVRNQDYVNWGLMGFYANPGTPASRYLQGHYNSDVRTQVNAEPPNLGNYVEEAFQDAGYALQWNNAGIPAGDSWTVEAFEVWTEGGAVQVLAPASQNVAPNTTVTLPFTVQNLSPDEATYTLSAASSVAGWTASLPNGASVTVPGNSSVTVDVAVNVPAGAVAADAANVTLTASAGAGLVRSATTTLTTVIVPMTLDVSSIDFTVVLTVVPGAPRVVTITSTGDDPITFGTLSILAPFAIGNDTCSGQTRTTGQSCTAEISFNPVTPGSYAANLNIPIVAPELLTRTIPVQGAYVDGATGAVDDTATALAGRPVTVAAPGVTANDVERNSGDRAAATVALVSGPANGVLTLNADGSFTYASDPAFTGVEVFSYKLVNPDASESNVARVRVTVNPDPITLDEPFDEPTPGNGCWQFLGAARMTAAGADPLDQSGDGWLRLTDAGLGQAGTAIYNCAIPTTDGFVAAFDYATYGGSGADGFTFYLIDGATATPTVGATGGALGYTFNGLNPGVTNGYVGVAFDEFGNFTQDGQGACADPPYAGGACPTFERDVFAIRGAGNLTSGFPLLTHVRGAGLSPARGVETGSREASRPVKISVFDNKFTLQVDFGSGYQTLIDNFNMGPGGAGQALPASFKFGFSGSTGGATNIHEIRRLVVSRPATLTVTNTDAAAEKVAGTPTTYTVTVTNGTENDVYFLDFSNPVPADIEGVTWACAAAGGGQCVTASGTGNAVQTVLHLPKGASVTFTIDGTLKALLPRGTVLSSVATISTPNGITNLAANAVTDLTTVANVAPVGRADSYVTPEDTPLVVAAPGVLGNDTDANPDTLTAVVVTGPLHGALTLNANGSFTYTPAAGFHGPDGFTYRASDGLLTSGVTEVSLTVTSVPDVPVAAPDAYTTAEDTPLVVEAAGVLDNDTDGDGDLLTAALVTGPAHGTVTLNADGSFTYTPAANYHGQDSFTYTASDDALASAPATVTITVTPVADLPTAVQDVYTTAEDTPLVVAAPGVLGNDTDGDGDTLAAALVTGPAHGVLTLDANGSFSYTPAANYHGPDGFTYRASDGLLTSGVTEVSLTVTPVDDAPVGLTERYVVRKNVALVVEAPGVLGNDTDVEGTGITAELVTGPTHGTLTMNADGGFTYAPQAGYVGADSFVYRPMGAGLDATGLRAAGAVAGNEVTVTLDVQQFEEQLHFAEGVFGGAFQTYLLLGNLGTEDAPAKVTFYGDGSPALERTFTVPAGRRLTLPASTIDGLAPGAFAMTVEALPEVVAARTVTWTADLGVGASQERAVPASATWHLAEGATGNRFDLFYLFANPSLTDADVEVTYLIEGADPVVKTYLVPAQRRVTVWVDHEAPSLADAGVSAAIRTTNGVPIVVERAMYLDAGDGRWVGGHAGAGQASATTEWFFAEGANGTKGFETYLLLGNPGDTAAEVTVTYLRVDGDPVTSTHVVAPKSRLTVPVLAAAPDLHTSAFGMHVVSTNGVPVAAERAMWWPRDGGTAWTEGHVGAGVPATGTQWATAEGVLGGPMGADTYLMVANPSATAGEVQVTLHFEDGRAPATVTLPIGAQRRLTLHLLALFPEADGTSFAVHVASVGASPVPLVVEQSVYWADAQGPWAHGVSAPAQRLR